MTEKSERYRAISEVAALLRESTQKKMLINVEGGEDTPLIETEYHNVVFDQREHADVKRAFLKMCNEA